MTPAPTYWASVPVPVCAVAALVSMACSSTPPPATPVAPPPPRAATAGDPLLRFLPAGADVVVEIDLTRLRSNPVVGDAVRAWLAPAAEAVAGAGTEAGTAPPLAFADTLVIAAYGVGTDSATTAMLLGGYRDRNAIAALGAVTVDDAAGAVLLAPPELGRRAEAAAGDAARSLGGDAALLALRARAMPERAEGAAVRAAARLSFDARVALASLLDADTVPASLSVWADVADDAALIAELDSGDGDGARLEAVAAVLRQRLILVPPVRAAGLPPALHRARIDRRGDHVRIVAVVGPQRLRRAAEYLAAAAPSLTKEPSP